MSGRKVNPMLAGHGSEDNLAAAMLTLERNDYKTKKGGKRLREQLPCDAPKLTKKTLEKNTWIMVMDTVRLHGKITSIDLAPKLDMTPHEAGNYMRMLGNEGRLQREQVKVVAKQKDGTNRTKTLWEYSLDPKYL